MVKILPPSKPIIPDPPPGLALHIAPAGHVFWLEDYEYYDQLGRDPFQQAKIWLMKDPEERVAKLNEVLKDYPKHKHRLNMLFEAAIRGDEALVQCLVDTGMKVHPDTSRVLSDEEKKAEEEAEDNGQIIDKDDPLSVPIHVATRGGHVGCLKILLDSHKDIEVRDRNGYTPLISGAEHMEVLRYLLGAGADPTARGYAGDDLPREDVERYEAIDTLEAAALYGNLEGVRLLLEHPFHGSTRKRKSRADEEPGIWVTPQSIKAASGADKNSLEMLQLLLERGAYPLEAKDGKTKGELLSDEERKAIEIAVPRASTVANLECLKLLLSYLYPTDLDGNILPFEMTEEENKTYVWGAYQAMRSNRPDMFEFVNGLGITEHESMSLDRLPDGQNLNFQALLERAAGAGSIDCARLMIEKYDADPNKHRIPPGTKPLFTAAMNDKPEMVQYLLENHGVDIHPGSGRYATGPTALYIAINLKSLGSVEHLLRKGGPVDHVDEEIRNISSPMTAVLKTNFGDPTVRLETQENAKDYLETWRGDWQNLNPPYVLLELAPEDKAWISELQPRRSPEELRETGPNARELSRDERVRRKDLDEKDPRRLMTHWPTIRERENGLAEDDDVLPKFRPFMRPARPARPDSDSESD